LAFVSGYRVIKDCIVAVVQKFHRERADFPEILGTGFLISPEGVVCTCRHIADAIRQLPSPPDYHGFPACVLVFTEIEKNGRRGVGVVNVDIESMGDAEVWGDTTLYLGPNPPEVSMLLLSVRETPAIEFATEPLQEGEEVAFGGFPMGTPALRAPGWLHQLSPSLQSGIVSAILPHHSDALPHAFLLHANTQPGASGSPVFRDDGKVVGMVYMALRNRETIGGGRDDAGFLYYTVPTSLTGCVPFPVLRQVYDVAKTHIPTKPRVTLGEYIRARRPIMVGSGGSVFTEWQGSDG